ncbi:hypothetical protein M0805_000155 [Coniferiporia weirii]|nr:hypothetical protein M0805_000155 [Coniferiporia weirii]
MDVNMKAAHSQGYTILRIKRKRDEDVPEVLVVEPSFKRVSKKRKGGLDVFQLAETVDAAAWSNVEQNELKNRIAELAKTAPDVSRKNRSDSVPAAPDVVSRTQSSQVPARQYRVVTQEESEFSRRSSRRATAPPKILSSKDLEKTPSNFKIYDAVLEPNVSEAETDPEMEKFQSLLRDYMTIDGSTTTHPDPLVSLTGNNATEVTTPSPDDYVYDIFYHRPSTLSEWVAASTMATVTGLPPTVDEDDLDSESEAEDEADEDSNAEDFYKNDYPDEESSEGDSEDMFHDYSDDDEVYEGRFEPED